MEVDGSKQSGENFENRTKEKELKWGGNGKIIKGDGREGFSLSFLLSSRALTPVVVPTYTTR